MYCGSVERWEIDLDATLFCGQAFRWKRSEEDGVKKYSAIIYGRFLTFIPKGDRIEIISDKKEHCGVSIEKFVEEYLGENLMMNQIFSIAFQKKYSVLYQSIQQYAGLRVLRQEPYETLISFMCAQGLGISLIANQVEKLCESFGEATPFGYVFPTPEKIASAKMESLIKATNNNHIRATNIQNISRAVCDGKLDLRIVQPPGTAYEKTKEILMSYAGIGNKIADCICLFGLRYAEAFPIDRHVRDFLEHWFRLKIKNLTPATYKELSIKAEKIFDTPYRGIAQQILFHHWRKNIKKL